MGKFFSIILFINLNEAIEIDFVKDEYAVNFIVLFFFFCQHCLFLERWLGISKNNLFKILHKRGL